MYSVPSAMAADEKHANMKRFSGDDTDDAGKQLRKFRNWCEAKMFTMKDLTDKQKAPFVYTLLDGRALESVEHLSLSDLMKEDGAATLWALLEARFPEKESEDQMGEALGEVFGLCAKDGESSQAWSARAREVFQKCERKARVQFPSQAQGWIALNCMGLSEEQKAIVKAKTQGKLEVELVTAALRSCFPVYKASASRSRRPVTTLIAEPDDGGGPDDDDDSFQDVEAFLADYGFDQPQEDRDEYQEEETAEALAATWKERRKEISKLQQRRGFKAQATDQARRSFRVEIEELKKRTRCRRCNRFGHWARECKAPIRSDGGSSSTTGGPNSSTDANLVQEEYAFVGAAEVVPEAQPNYQTEALNDSAPKVNESLSAGLVSSPGFGVVDSGCGRTLIGKDTLIALTRKLEDVTTRKPDVYQQQSVFRFGNGATEESSQAVRIPVGIAKKLGVIDAAIIEGKAPLLLGRPSLERLRVVLNFQGPDHALLGPGRGCLDALERSRATAD